MTDNLWPRLKPLLEEAACLEGEERARFVREHAGEDPELRRELNAILAAEDIDFLERPVPACLSLEGTMGGSWLIGSHLGSGGSGAVYLAERQDGDFDQKAALKILKLGMDTEESVRRFKSERRILARLEHPNIARLLDGGAMPDGRPYLVMEYVDGLPVHEYCRRNSLGIDACLTLFCKVCDAVAYAHRNLIIHRDLKPGNILVTRDGEPKLLDFGIARLTTAAAEQTVTVTRGRCMTPEYASPEQVCGRPVTTAGDIYSLGVVLYELLAGRRPYDLQGLTPAQIQDVICRQAPLKPVAARGQGRGKGATGRGRMDGDLEKILMKALNKEPARRYASVQVLADDLKRFQEGFPVLARKETAAYTMVRFVMRNKLTSGLVALSAVLLLSFSILVSIQNRRILQERQYAGATADFLIEMLQVADPHDPTGGATTVKELLEHGLEQLRRETGQNPGTRAALQLSLGKVYLNTGQYQKAELLLIEAVENAATAGRMVAAMGNLAKVRHELGQFDESETLYLRALELSGEQGLENTAAHARLETRLGSLYIYTGQPYKAQPLFDSALRKMRENHPGDPELAIILQDTAVFYGWQSDCVTAEPLLREALAIFEKHYGKEHFMVARSLNILGIAMSQQRKYEEAQAFYRRSQEILEKTVEKKHPEYSALLNNMAVLYQRMGLAEKAERYFLSALDATRAVYGQDHVEVGRALCNLASFYAMLNRDPEAAALFKEGVPMIADKVGPDHPQVTLWQERQASVMYCMGL
ncbi:MAG: serine/threonine-protein kinase [Acidobacteriota bacterium]|nr:serine/threonine-protein kinase [Acidobacteriota bacterium]